jgi:ATP-dependent Clp protease ATP-binding subunit ClpC
VFERFTDRARRVVVLAQTEAAMLNHNYIGTEHLLLGLIHEGRGVSAQVFRSLDISVEAARRQVEEIIGRGRGEITAHIPFTPRAKKVLELSLGEALQLGHNHIGSEHLLLGLIREGEGVAAQVLRTLGADLNHVRQAVLRLLAGPTASATEQEPWEPWMPASGPHCPRCSRPLERTLAHRTLLVPAADDEGEPISVDTLFCTGCGGLVRTSLD